MAKKKSGKKTTKKKTTRKQAVARKPSARKKTPKKLGSKTARRAKPPATADRRQASTRTKAGKKSAAKAAGKKSRSSKAKAAKTKSTSDRPRKSTTRGKGSGAVTRKSKVSATGLPAAPAPPPAPPQPPKPAVGSFVWHELMTNNTERCGDFYQGLFNWSRNEKEVIPGVTYTVFRNASNDNAGMMAMAGPDWEGQPPRWIPYVKVKSVEASVTKAEQLGGRVVVPPSDIAEGRFAVVADPSGAAIGVFTEEGTEGPRD